VVGSSIALCTMARVPAAAKADASYRRADGGRTLPPAGRTPPPTRQADRAARRRRYEDPSGGCVAVTGVKRDIPPLLHSERERTAPIRATRHSARCATAASGHCSDRSALRSAQCRFGLERGRVVMGEARRPVGRLAPVIREATRADAGALASLHRASIGHLCAGTYSEAEVAAWTDGLEPHVYDALIASAYVVVAEENGALAGFGVCDSDASVVNAVYVAPGSARRGVGRRLMRALESHLVQAGVSEARLNATLNAVPFYAALGYVSMGAATNRLPSGVELACVAMTKRLPRGDSAIGGCGGGRVSRAT
jgi:putative acetyltransferase